MNCSYIDYRIIGENRVRQSEAQLKEMLTSPFWLDCFDYINELIADLHFQLENPEHQLSHRELDRIGGRCEALRMLAGLPILMIEKRKQQDELKGKEISDE